MFGELLESLEGLGGWALAAGVAVVAAPVVARALRPVAKGAIKGYLAMVDGAQTAMEGARTRANDARESVHEIVQEAKAERTTNGSVSGA